MTDILLKRALLGIALSIILSYISYMINASPYPQESNLNYEYIMSIEINYFLYTNNFVSCISFDNLPSCDADNVHEYCMKDNFIYKKHPKKIYN